MSEVTISNSPVHSQSYVSQPYGVYNPNIQYTCGFHTGLDIIPYGTTENNPLLYSCVKGRIVATPTDNTLGVQVQIEDENGLFWRYCHMVEGSRLVQVGQQVDINTPIGRMGDTGNVTGRHLHLELSTTQSWNCDNFLNPALALGIPNETGTIINYDGTIPPEPTPEKINKNKWFKSLCKKIIIKY